MNRNNLTEAFGRLVTAEGYNFHSAEEAFMAEQIKAYPVVWLCEPKFEQMEGRKHGKVTYSVRLHAMAEGAKLTSGERSKVFGELEEKLVKIFMGLSKERLVIAVESLQISCESGKLTPHGEVAATATARVVTMF